MEISERAYRVPLRLRALLGGLCIAGAAAASLLCLTFEIGPGGDAAARGLTAAALGCAALAGLAALRLAGRVVLTGEGLELERLGRRRFISFSSIVELRPRRAAAGRGATGGWPGGWIVRSRYVSIPLSDQLEGFVELLAALRARAPVGAPEDDVPLPLRVPASLLGWAAILLLPALLCGAAAAAVAGGRRDLALALLLPAQLWVLCFGLLVPTSIEIGPRRLRILYLLRQRSLPLSALRQARLVTQEQAGAQASALELRFLGPRYPILPNRPVRIGQALLPFPLPVLRDRLEELGRLRRDAERARAARLYNAGDRRQNRRALP